MILKTVFLLFTATITAFTTPSKPKKSIKGKISYYASKFEGRRTSSGQRYKASRKTAAHKSFPFGTLLEVTNKENGNVTVVKVNDRGPHSRGRILDVSYAAAKDLGLIKKGTASVVIKVLSFGDGIVDPNEEEDDFTMIPQDSTQQTSMVDALLKRKPMYMMVVKDAEGRIRLDSTEIRPLNLLTKE